jgi:4-hydroxybenzoate polyprenyltransferase
MLGKEKNLNLVGQVRIYSLIDLIIFGFALGSNYSQLAGIIFLHLGFLLFLEKQHNHKYRVKFPKSLWIVFLGLGVLFYNSYLVIGFIFFSYLYTKKNCSIFGLVAPFFRGFQYYFLAVGIVGFSNPLSFLAFSVLTIRNFIGDLRDVEKDKKERLLTLPMFIGVEKSFNHLHLVALLVTTFIWGYLAAMNPILLVFVWIIQIKTYNFTPR